MRIQKPNKGFTIVELLIVIVVIAILAAITIVAYNGVSARAKTSSAKSAAQTVAKKAEIYKVETGLYPASAATLTNTSNSGTAYFIAGITFLGAAPNNPTNPNTVALTRCDAGTGATGGLGNQVIYWNYETQAVSALVVGDTAAACQYAP